MQFAEPRQLCEPEVRSSIIYYRRPPRTGFYGRVTMALSIVTGSSRQVWVWTLGSRRDENGEASPHGGWPYEADYRALAELMREQHREESSELESVMGHAVFEDHLMSDRPPKDRHQDRNVNSSRQFVH